MTISGLGLSVPARRERASRASPTRSLWVTSREFTWYFLRDHVTRASLGRLAYYGHRSPALPTPGAAPAATDIQYTDSGSVRDINMMIDTQHPSVLQSRDAHGTKWRHARDHEYILIACARVASLKSPPPHRRDRRTWILGLSFPSLSFSGDSRSNYITALEGLGEKVAEGCHQN